MGFERIIGRGLGHLVANAVNNMDGHPPKHHEPVTRDRIVQTMFGNAGYNLMSDKGQDELLLKYMNTINPPPKELTEGQKLFKDPKQYLTDFMSDYKEDVPHEQLLWTRWQYQEYESMEVD